jgi:hypothetical protein
MPNDPKWRTIAKKSGQAIGNVIAVYLHVLVNASANDETQSNAGVTQSNAGQRGVTHNLDPEDVASSLDLEVEQVLCILSAMQGKVLDGPKVTGWAKRQPKREDDSAARVKAFREKQRAEKLQADKEKKGVVTQSNAGVTQRNAPDKDKDKDTDKDPDKDLKHTQRARESPVDNSMPEKPGDKIRMHSSWQPDPGFMQRSETWGRVLTGPDPGYTAAELTEFCAYWMAEGVTFAPVQWEQKFSLYLMTSRANSGRRRGNGLVGDLSSMDYEIPKGFNGR